MEHIIEILRKASDCYYNSDNFYEMTEEEQVLVRNNLGLTVERVVSDEVFDSIYFKVKEMLPNHPFFLSVGATVRGEKELEIKKNLFDEYAKISHDIVSEVKKEGDIGSTIFDFRKIVVALETSADFLLNIKCQIVIIFLTGIMN